MQELVKQPLTLIFSTIALTYFLRGMIVNLKKRPETQHFGDKDFWVALGSAIFAGISFYYYTGN